MQRYELNEGTSDEGRQRLLSFEADRQRGNAFDPKLMTPKNENVQRQLQGQVQSMPMQTRVPVTMPMANPYMARPFMGHEPTSLSLSSPLFMQMSTLPASFSIYNKSVSENNAQTH